jgi:hypothetical protein
MLKGNLMSHFKNPDLRIRGQDSPTQAVKTRGKA